MFIQIEWFRQKLYVALQTDEIGFISNVGNMVKWPLLMRDNESWHNVALGVTN
jgi:hypothetical protein